MSYTIHNVDQRSQEWMNLRAGRLTGSVAADMMRKQKSGQPSAARKHLRTRLALERITGRPQEREFTTAAVQHGIDKEPALWARHESETGDIIQSVGFLSLGPVMAGCSLDGAVFSGGSIMEIIEGKAPESATHLEYLRTREIPEDYRWQCIHNLWVSGAKRCRFISFDDRFPDDLQYLCVTLDRNEREIEAYQAEAQRFLAEVAIEVQEIEKIRRKAA